MSDILIELMKTVLAVLTPILTGVLVALAAKWLQKLGITLDASKQAALEHGIANLVFEVEEWASARIKAGIPTTAQEKAEQFLARAAVKIPNVTADEATALAQSFLGRVRTSTVAVLQDVQAATGSK